MQTQYNTDYRHIAYYNPLRYRGYIYDQETGLYYLQSRYYDPEIGRFINADAFVSTGQGLLGNNMFAYCNNNPVSYVDFSGDYPLKASFTLLDNWLNGNGTTQYYDEASKIVDKLSKSDKLEELSKSAIENYKAGQPITKGTSEFTADEDGWDLYLSTQHFDYTITVTEENRTSGILWWKHEEVRYIATVEVHDRYDFDAYRDWNSFGNVMNNIAYTYYLLGGGHDFEWYATYIYKTKWTDIT